MILALTLLLACANPAENVTPATVTEPAPAPVAPAAPETPAAAPASFTGAPLVATGSVGFVGAKITKSHEGSFSQWSGTLYVDADKLSGLSVDVSVTSLSTGEEKLDRHLKSEDFFDVEKNPTATFRSTGIADGAPADSQLPGANATVTGDLSMHGVTRSVSFPAFIQVSPDKVEAKTEFFVNRKDFGIVYPGKPDDLIKDEVVLRVALSAPRG